MRNRHGSDAIYRRILAAGVRSSRGTRIRSFSGECAPHQEPAGAEIGRTGVPMADEAAHLSLSARSRLAPWLRTRVIEDVDDGIWLVSFMEYDLGYIDLGENIESHMFSIHF